MSNEPQLRTRKPTGIPAWPVTLIAGEAKTGKTFRAAEFTGDPRVGRSFVLDIGEGSADEYIGVPGADYEIIDHDGTWVDIVEQARACREVARAELAAGRPPVCLIVDSVTWEWAMLSEWTQTRAKRSKNNRKLLAVDKDAEIDVGSNYWNDATSRHNQLMNILKTFPGFVIMIATEKEVTVFGPDGKPTAQKAMKPDAQKRVTADATVWIRLSHDNAPVCVGLRSLKTNIVPGEDRPRPIPNFTLAGFLLDTLGFGAVGAQQVRNTPQLDADQVAPGEEVQPQGQEQQARPQQVQRPASHRAPTSTGQKEAQRQVKLDAAQTAAKGTVSLVNASSLANAKQLAGYASDSVAKDMDITGFLTHPDDKIRAALDQVKENLDIRDGEPLTLADFGALVVSFWERTGCPVTATPDVIAEVAEKIKKAFDGVMQDQVREMNNLVRESVAG
jgi:hypothetical protein